MGLMSAQMITSFHSWITTFIKWILGRDKNYSPKTASLMRSHHARAPFGSCWGCFPFTEDK